MKKINLLFMVLVCLLISSCKKEKLMIECDDIIMYQSETKEICPTSNYENATYSYTSNEDELIIIDGVITPLKTGVFEVLIKLNGKDVSKKIEVEVKEPSLVISGDNIVVYGERLQLELSRYGIPDDAFVLWSTSDKKVATVSSSGLVKPVDYGKAIIKATANKVTATFEVEVIHPTAEKIEVDFQTKMEVNGIYQLAIDIDPYEASKEFKFEQTNDLLSFSENAFTALKEGTTKVTLTSLSDSKFKFEFEVIVVANEAPRFEKREEFEDVLKINYADYEAILQGLNVVDNADGDICDRVTFDESLLLSYGEKEIELTVTDHTGNSTTFSRKVNVVYEYHTKFIGHAGCNLVLPNTEEAFLIAARDFKYQAIECDLQVTKDGVYVTNHDSTFAGYTISKYTYDFLKDIEYTASNGKKGKLCTLDRYLEICKEYNCIAVIEIKGSSPGLSAANQDGIPKLMKYIEEKGMLDQCIMLTSTLYCLIRIRDEGYTVPCQYLVNTCESEATLTICKTYHFDLSTNVTYGGPNSDAWLQRYKDAGIKISVWTFSGEYSQVQKWIDKGVDFVTCDCHYMEKLKLK